MHFKIRIGKTRIVIVYGKYAYKIVRIRAFDLMCKWIKLEYERKKLGDAVAYKNLRRPSRKQLVRDMLWACFQANYQEYTLWHTCTIDKRKYVPTFLTLIYFINIQERDDVAEGHNKIISRAHNRRCGDLLHLKEQDFVDNVAHATGRILDYGHQSAAV